LFLALISYGALSTPAYSLEIWRNQTRYEISIALPDGEQFRNVGIDRKFTIGSIDGNLRLIQDSYSECTSLIDERVQNQAKNGFSHITARNAAQHECSIGLKDDANGRMMSSFYIWLEPCRCFSALHFYYTVNDRASYLAMVQPILDSLRSNNGPTEQGQEVASAVGQNTAFDDSGVGGRETAEEMEDDEADSASTTDAQWNQEYQDQLNKSGIDEALPVAHEPALTLSDLEYDVCTGTWNKLNYYKLNQPKYLIVGKRSEGGDKGQAECFEAHNPDTDFNAAEAKDVRQSAYDLCKQTFQECYDFADGNRLTSWAAALALTVMNGNRARNYRNHQEVTSTPSSGDDEGGSDAGNILGSILTGLANGMAAGRAINNSRLNSMGYHGGSVTNCPEGYYRASTGYGQKFICEPYPAGAPPIRDSLPSGISGLK
jgi:hypothetical protein